MAKGAQYWGRRRSKQLGRFSGKAIKAYTQPSVASIAQAAWSGTKYLRTLINSEVFIRDSGPTTTTPNGTATVLHITAIDQGDLDSNRTGFSILAKNLFIKFFVGRNPSATSTILRLVVVQDKQQIGDTSPGYSDVFTSTSTLSQYNNATSGRFTILHDRTIVLDAVSNSTMYYTYKHSFAGKSNHIRFNGAAGSDIQKNGIYLFLISSEGTNTPTVISNTRFTYHDN